MTAGSNAPAWQDSLDKLKTWARVNSPWAIHFNTGSCNGCDIEILATLTPRYDLERFGVKLQGSPRHADVLICTGPVTRQARDRLKRVYEQMPSPKFVVAVGSCATSGGVFAGCYGVVGHVDQVIPVDAYVPGCPPRPEAIIDGVVKLLARLQSPVASLQPAVSGPGSQVSVDSGANGKARGSAVTPLTDQRAGNRDLLSPSPSPHSQPPTPNEEARP